MVRPLRIELAGGLYHVTSRGDCREHIFLNDADRRAWLDVFGQVCKRFNWVCHAWCQMTNHYHIVVETVEGNLSQGMRQLNGVYTQHVNRTHGRVGHVFQGRYKAILVERDSYLLELARYVVLNPVRAGLVNDVGLWPWGSYAATVGEAVPPPWLQTDWILGQLALSRSNAVRQYIHFVRAGVGLPSVWEGLRGQVYLGSEAFLLRMQALSDKADIAEIPRAQRRPPAQPLSQYRDAFPEDPHAAMAAAYMTGDYTMQQIAECFGVHYATVSRAVSRWEKMHECKT
jgi:REP element-mobilizing transposase RayT